MHGSIIVALFEPGHLLTNLLFLGQTVIFEIILVSLRILSSSVVLLESLSVFAASLYVLSVLHHFVMFLHALHLCLLLNNLLGFLTVLPALVSLILSLNAVLDIACLQGRIEQLALLELLCTL